MNTLVAIAPSGRQANDTLTAWEDSSFIEQARRHSLAGNPAVVPPSAWVNAVGGSVIPANGRPMASSIRVMHRAERLRDGGGNAGKWVQLPQGKL